MSRIACLRIPRFQIVVHQKHEPELKGRPFVLISGKAGANGTVSGGKRIAMCSQEANRQRVFAGMTLAEARAACADLVWRECDLSLSRQEERNITARLIASSPRVSVLEPGAFLLDATGRTHIGGESKLCRDALKIASQLGFCEGTVGVADSAFAAFVASKFKRRRWYMVPVGCDSDFLSALSVEHLPVDEEMQNILIELGIKTIGQFASLPFASVAERFGDKGMKALTLAHGYDKRQPSLPPVEKQFRCSMDMGGPVEALNDTLFVMKSMLDRLAEQLKESGLCADELLLSFYNDNDKFDERTIKLIRPANHSKFLLEVLRLSLESKPLSREFTSLHLCVSRYSKESWQQENLLPQESSSQSDEATLSEAFVLLLQRFMLRLGNSVLLKPVANDQYFPEHAGKWVPVYPKTKDSALPINLEYAKNSTQSEGLMKGLVLRKNDPPLPALVEFKDSRPSALTLKGEWYTIKAISSPECLSGLWWEEPVRKAYYVALLEPWMLILLTYEYDNKQWLIEGIFD